MARDRIWHVATDPVGIETELFRHGLAPGFGLFIRLDDNPPGNSYSSCTGRHRLGHHCIGTDLGACAYRERTEHFGTCADHYTIFQRRVALAGIPAGTAKGHALIKRHVIADLGGFTDHDAHAMVDEKAATDACTG